MYSNFITPPDYIQSILVVDASEDQIKELTELLHDVEQPYNIYLYSNSMDNQQWIHKMILRADVILLQQDSDAPVVSNILFGPDQKLKSPADYFNK